MKTLLAVLTFILIFTLTLSAQQPQEKWFTFAGNAKSLFAYSKSKVQKMPNGNLKIWLRVSIKTAPDSSDYQQRLNEFVAEKNFDSEKAKSYSNYLHTMNIVEMDCTNQKFFVRAGYDYDRDGFILDSWSTENKSLWNDIVPGSTMEHLLSSVCGM